MPMKKQLGSVTTALLCLAALWALAQFVLAFFLHVTERARMTQAGLTVPPTKTYMQAYAASEVILTVLVLGIVAVVSALLSRRIRGGQIGAGRVAWGLSIATLVFGIIGFTYLFGVAVLLCLACASVRDPRAATAGAARRPARPAALG
jgi:hypothetical protein